MLRKTKKGIPKLRSNATMIFNVALLSKVVLVLFVYLWWHIQLHQEAFLTFDDVLTTTLLYVMVAINVVGIINFWLIQRTKAIGVFVNALLLIIGIGAMLFTDNLLVLEDRLYPIIAIVVVDVMLGYIALLGLKK